MEKRALYYWATLFASQMHIGMPYEELKKTIGINISTTDFGSRQKGITPGFCRWKKAKAFC
jgi:predicted transposase/invertase (TIGR01784 family)